MRSARTRRVPKRTLPEHGCWPRCNAHPRRRDARSRPERPVLVPPIAASSQGSVRYSVASERVFVDESFPIIFRAELFWARFYVFSVRPALCQMVDYKKPRNQEYHTSGDHLNRQNRRSRCRFEKELAAEPRRSAFSECGSSEIARTPRNDLHGPRTSASFTIWFIIGGGRCHVIVSTFWTSMVSS